jgi:hypothetical protein
MAMATQSNNKSTENKDEVKLETFQFFNKDFKKITINTIPN